jgi:16S rRNA (guanine527-N7)-methyltransferase
MTPPSTAAEVQSVLAATDAQIADLESFRALVAEWNARINLVGPSALAQFWPRHAYDSAQLLALAPRARAWADLGAGAGFPGVVLAILLKGQPGARVHLVESMAKRCRFLAQAAEILDLPVDIHNARAEDLALTVDVVTARALAPLNRLLGYAQPYLDRGALGLFLKGQDAATELADAALFWKFEAELSASLSHPDGRIVHVRGLARVHKA